MNSKERKELLKSCKKGYILYWHHLNTQTDPFTEGYIGITMNNPSIYYSRFSSLIKNYSKSIYFYNAIKRYGEDNIITTIIYEGLTLEQSNYLEYLYRKTPKIGWNIRQGGGNHGKLPEETKRKISINRKGKNHLLYDKIFTDKSRMKIKLSKIGNTNRLGQKHTKETKKKMSISAKKREVSENTRLSRLKKVICLDTNEIYISQKDAEVKTGISRKYISACCVGRQKTAGGMKWKFFEE